MATYRIRHAGYFMGTYYAEGTQLELHPKQAKYALLSGQLEAVGTSHAQAKAAQSGPGPARRAAPFTNPFQERSARGGSVGGTFGGTAKR